MLSRTLSKTTHPRRYLSPIWIRRLGDPAPPGPKKTDRAEDRRSPHSLREGSRILDGHWLSFPDASGWTLSYPMQILFVWGSHPFDGPVLEGHPHVVMATTVVDHRDNAIERRRKREKHADSWWSVHLHARRMHRGERRRGIECRVSATMAKQSDSLVNTHQPLCLYSVCFTL